MFEAYLEIWKMSIPPCVFVEIFGMECPGCGMTTALVFLLKGDVVNSLKAHPGLIPLLALSAFMIVHMFKQYKNGGTIIRWGMIAFSAICLIQWVVKQSEHAPHI